MTTIGQQVQQASDALLETSRQIVNAERQKQSLGELKELRRMLERQLRDATMALRESEASAVVDAGKSSPESGPPIVAEAATAEGIEADNDDTEIDENGSVSKQ